MFKNYGAVVVALAVGAFMYNFNSICGWFVSPEWTVVDWLKLIGVPILVLMALAAAAYLQPKPINDENARRTAHERH